MTTINNIADPARIFREQPEWADIVRGIPLSRELLELPERFARFVEAVDGKFQEVDAGFSKMESQFGHVQSQFDRVDSQFRQVDARFDQVDARFERVDARFDRVESRLDRVESRLDHVETRLGRVEGRVGNPDGPDYERKVRYGVLHPVQDRFTLENAYLALTQNDPRAPQLNSAIAAAIRNQAITREESEDLHNADIIISDPADYHVVVETSINVDQEDIGRAKRRAGLLGKATGHTVMPAVVTSTLTESQQEHAASEEVTVFLIPYP